MCNRYRSLTLFSVSTLSVCVCVFLLSARACLQDSFFLVFFIGACFRFLTSIRRSACHLPTMLFMIPRGLCCWDSHASFNNVSKKVKAYVSTYRQPYTYHENRFGIPAQLIRSNRGSRSQRMRKHREINKHILGFCFSFEICIFGNC